ncbi:MAG: glycoside hydrolase family 15 protein, partial [Corynebacterium matruchotii]|uniref:glycoside hydrolase family 15 protein n=1 Tax=Corynebacterium matruchotii TaxID=43768 RepID=UPI00361366DB
RGFDAERNTFRQIYDNPGVDASLLQLPHTGIIAVTDQRMHDTVAAIVRELGDDHGLIYRYNSDGHRAEYPFLICNFWLAEHYARAGHLDAATRLLEQLVGYANDLGLLAEEYDPVRERLAGNFPQAFSHIGVIRAVDAIARAQ